MPADPAHRPLPPPGVPVGSTLLAAVVAFLLLAGLPIDAGPGAPPRHGALSREVSIDGRLGRQRSGWQIQLEARSGAATERRCRVSATLTRVQASPMARAMPISQVVWNTTVALDVPAGGVFRQALALPAEIAQQIPEPGSTEKAPSLEPRSSFGVRIEASCGTADSGSVG